MAIQIREQLKRWFSRGKYPTEEQFADAFDSFFHKSDKIGMGSMAQEVIDTFNNKADVAALHLKYSNGQRVFGLSYDSVIFYAKDGSVIAELDAASADPELYIGNGRNGKLDEVHVDTKEVVWLKADNIMIDSNRPTVYDVENECCINFTPEEIKIYKGVSPVQVTTLANYVGDRIDERVGSYRAVVQNQATGLTVFTADFRTTELKIILAEPSASTVVSALTILEPDVPEGLAYVRHLIIRNTGQYTINFPSVVLGKEMNVEAGQKLDASYLFYRSNGRVVYDLTFNVI